jgi:hypothetical protein
MRQISFCSALLLAGCLAGPATAQQSFQDAAMVKVVDSTQATLKAVPRGEKAAVDVVGPILAGGVITDHLCTGGSVVLLYIKVGPNPIAALCSVSACGQLRIGQRVRLQGGLSFAPDFASPGFDPCDRNTWTAGLTSFFVATKVTK